MAHDLKPGARVVWAPVKAGTVKEETAPGVYVVDLDEGWKITCGEGVLVAVPEVPDAG